LPIVALCLLELLLRLCDYGYSPHFFLRAKLNGQDVFVENQKFSRRYFPPALARTPQPALFAAAKAADTFRVFVFGESAAMGDPEPSFGFSRILEVLLAEKIPAKRIEVINVAVTAINSHVIRQIARDCASKQGDLWIIYMGHNEVVGPYGAGTIFGAQTPPLPLIRANIAIKGTRLGQLFDSVRARFSKTAAPAEWEGMEMFLKQQIRAGDPRMPRVYSHFQRNLEDVVDMGLASGAHVLLSTVPSNLKDCPPFGSLHRPNLSSALQAEWEQTSLVGIEAESKTNLQAALQAYEKCEQIDPDHAELHFRMARCFIAIGNTNAAHHHFVSARDLDTLRFRADTKINQIIHTVAGKHAGESFAFLDAIELFLRASFDGITGDNFLYEHVHPNFEGNYLLARSMAEKTLSIYLGDHPKAGESSSGSWFSPGECADRLALTDWDRLQITDEMIRRFEQRPFTQQLDQKQRMQRWRQQRETLQGVQESDRLTAAIAVYERALQSRPGDWILHENFAKLLQATSDPPGAEREWRKVLDLMPHSEQAMYSLGNVLDAQGKSAEALGLFQRALQKRPNSFEAHNGAGLALSSQGKTDQAIENYRAALRNKPEFAEARINLGQALAQLGRDDEAIAEYRTALRLNSNNAAAHINLGKALARRNLVSEAEKEYEAAAGAEPNNAVAHYNLGNLLAGRADDRSLAEFQLAVRCDRRFAEARYNLGLAYAARNRTTEAISEFKTTVKLRPQWVEAHLNLGVALARTERYADAMAEFQEALRLDPGNAAAKKFLAEAQSRLAKP
jgi:tetratricopeptide (TPR) repeat protein